MLGARAARHELGARMTKDREAGIDERAVRRAVDELQTRIESCHERVPCPKCGAQRGERCHSLARRSTAKPREVKHPHRERWGVPFR